MKKSFLIRKSVKILDEGLRALCSPRMLMTCVLMCGVCFVFAQDAQTGVSALESVATDIKTYLPAVQNVIYAIAGIVAIAGAISVYISMNNEEQDVKKKIMMIVGACIFLIAAAQALPLFFGYGG